MDTNGVRAGQRFCFFQLISRITRNRIRKTIARRRRSRTNEHEWSTRNIKSMGFLHSGLQNKYSLTGIGTYGTCFFGRKILHSSPECWNDIPGEGERGNATASLLAPAGSACKRNRLAHEVMCFSFVLSGE